MRPHAEGRLATLLPRSNRSSKVPQAVSSPSGPPVPPAEQAAAKDRLVHGPAGRQQLATPPSSSAAEPPFEAPSAAMLSAHHAEHDYQSTTCMEAEPSGLLSAPWDHAPSSPRIMPPVLGRVRRSWKCARCEVWRQAHLKQPLGSRDGSRTRQRGVSGLKSITGFLPKARAGRA